MSYDLDDRIEALLDQPVHGSNVNVMLHCPLGHEDRTPSFSIHRIEGVFNCFSCGQHGSLTKLYKLLGEEIDDDFRFDSLVKSVYREPERRTNFSVLSNFQHESLATERGQLLLGHYLSERPIAASFVEEFYVGYNETFDALAFPYWNSEGYVVGIKYRHADGSKSAETNSQFGLYHSENVVGRGTVVIGESESDCHSIWSLFRDDPTVAVCSTSGAISSKTTWAKFGLPLLFARRIFLAQDADAAGDKSAEVAAEVLGQDKCIRLRPTIGKDWAESILQGEDTVKRVIGV